MENAKVIGELLKEPVIILLVDSLKDPRCSIFPYGGEIDVLDKAMEGVSSCCYVAFAL